jgi:hypothetical protein
MACYGAEFIRCVNFSDPQFKFQLFRRTASAMYSLYTAPSCSMRGEKYKFQIGKLVELWAF